jgi:hypothetical protein
VVWVRAANFQKHQSGREFIGCNFNNGEDLIPPLVFPDLTPIERVWGQQTDFVGDYPNIHCLCELGRLEQSNIMTLAVSRYFLDHFNHYLLFGLKNV